MSVPIVLMTIEARPSFRNPLKPSNPLPWKDCYISAFFGVKVRSPSFFTHDPVDCMIDLDEFTRHDEFLSEDVEQQIDLTLAKRADQRKATHTGDVELDPSSETHTPDSASLVPTEHFDADAGNALEELLAQIFASDDAPQVSTIKEFAHPEEIF